MIQKYAFSFILLPIFLLITAFKPTPETTTFSGDTVKWYSWDEAIEANKKEKKKIMIDLYTSWCGWCKVMDKKTFSDPEVAAYLNENFYPVKFNAEQKEDIVFNEHTFSYVKNGRRGVHMLAYSLADGKLSYPSIVYMDGDIKRITISPGFKDAKAFMKELNFVGGEHYKTKTFQQFEKELNK